MSTLSIEPADGRRQREPGETIEVVAQWQLDNPPDSVEARLVWNTRGKGDTDVQVVAVEAFDSPRQAESRRCTFQLPSAPYSFSGKLISLLWALELIAEPSGQSHRCEITMAPGGQEVVLQRREGKF